MSEYKSKQVQFFKNNKLICIGDPILPSIIKLVKKVSPNANSTFIGRLIELAIFAFMLSSIILLALYFLK